MSGLLKLTFFSLFAVRRVCNGSLAAIFLHSHSVRQRRFECLHLLLTSLCFIIIKRIVFLNLVATLKKSQPNLQWQEVKTTQWKFFKHRISFILQSHMYILTMSCHSQNNRWFFDEIPTTITAAILRDQVRISHVVRVSSFWCLISKRSFLRFLFYWNRLRTRTCHSQLSRTWFAP